MHQFTYRLFNRKLLIAFVIILAVTSTSYSYATTIGTNITTAGTLTVQSDSASAILFQNAAGSSTIFKFDNANSRFGILAGNALDTSFELGGAASVSGAFTQTGATASNSFAGSITITKGLTANSYQGGGLSGCNSSQFLQYTAGQFGCGTAGTISAQSGIAAGQIAFWQSSTVASGSSTLFWDSTNKRLGLNYGTAVDTAFEVGGTASASMVRYKAAASDTNCSSTASPAVCGSAAAGSVTVDATATTKTVNTTAVTADSQIMLTVDSSLGSRLGVTCNTTIPVYSVSARTAGTSFVITVTVAPLTNPACFNYLIVN